MTRPQDLVLELADELAATGVPSPGADARWLVAHAVGVDLGQLFLRPELTDDEIGRVRELASRRAEGEPVQHITGEAPFRFETLRVGPGVFVPRPETELVAGRAIEILAERTPERRRVVEPCAGSGAISRAIVRELGHVEAYANERSPRALDYLYENLRDTDVRVVPGDFRTALTALSGRADVVVCNPPYVPETVRASLPADVVGRDPDEALFAGPDGLAVIRDLHVVAAALLRADGWLVTEHDESHQEQVVNLLVDAGWQEVVAHRDLTGRPRFVEARWPGGPPATRWQDGARE